MIATGITFEQNIIDNQSVMVTKRVYIPPQLIILGDAAIQTGMPDKLVESSNGISFAGS